MVGLANPLSINRCGASPKRNPKLSLAAADAAEDRYLRVRTGYGTGMPRMYREFEHEGVKPGSGGSRAATDGSMLSDSPENCRDSSEPDGPPGRRFRAAMYAFIRSFALVLYCIVIFLALDFAYSSLFLKNEKLRIRDKVFHHGLVANYDGYDVWGENQHRFFTNNLGYKDAAVRAVAPECATRRILLIGDSFTEGIGLSFEDSFAGLLFQAGKQLEPPVEFLNAGVISYSPSLYYKKVRHLVEHGWCVNEVVVFPDLSDIPDEAVGYFCFDDDPKYHRYCNPDNLYDVPEQWTFNKFLQRSFKITDRVRLIVKHYLIYDSERIAKLFNWSDFTGWADAGCDTGNGFKPLGVESGIARALQNMGRLADYLAQKNIPLSIVVYPWPVQIAQSDHHSRYVSIWRDFCATRCKRFINTIPAFSAQKEAHADWYKRLFIFGDVHYNAEGNRVLYEVLAKELLGRSVGVN
ncbi:MAG: hypothetical protein R3D62_21885 [Xanthobacteraceae bacterium]